MAKPKVERVVELIRRLEAAPAPRTAAEALIVLTTVLEEVEDEHSDVPNDPSSPFADERIWPPIAKYAFAVADRDDLEGYRQRGHETIIGANGAIMIRTRRGASIILDKPGHDGRKVDL